MKLRVGDWVEVRSREEILATLDRKGELEGLPFMPEMFRYCGQRFQVYKRAHKTCDTVNYDRGGGRRLENCVHLELRCEGDAHGGCQAACLLFWKTPWLSRVDKEVAVKEALPARVSQTAAVQASSCATEADVQAATRPAERQSRDEVVYACQATLLPSFTTYLPWWDLRQYLEDFVSGNATVGRMFRGFLFSSFYWYCGTGKRKGAHRLQQLYDRLQALRGGIPYPKADGILPAGQPTTHCTLDLKPGELVRVKPFEEIRATLTTENKNRGLLFDAELVPYCGGTYRVRSRVEKFVDEKTGRMTIMKTPAVILENVWCQARYSDCRLFCPRSIYSWWREVWLERVSEPHPEAPGNQER